MASGNVCGGVQIGPVHVGADRLDRGPLAGVEAGGQQPGQTVLRPLGGQADHFTVYQIGEHCVELTDVHSNRPRAEKRGCDDDSNFPIAESL